MLLAWRSVKWPVRCKVCAELANVCLYVITVMNSEVIVLVCIM